MWYFDLCLILLVLIALFLMGIVVVCRAATPLNKTLNSYKVITYNYWNIFPKFDFYIDWNTNIMLRKMKYKMCGVIQKSKKLK